MSNRISIVSNYRIAYLTFCLSLITLPINISFIGIVRLPDVFIIITVIILAFSNPTFKTVSVLIFSSFFVILLFSDILSLFQRDISYTGVVFYYKYSLLFIIPYVVSHILINRNRLLFLVKILYSVYLVLVIWVYIYNVLLENGMIIANPRVSYPFSNFHLSDAHVYASYLSFMFVAYFEYLRKIMNHGLVHSSMMFFLTLGALFLTGSKSGILIILIYSLFVVVTRNILLSKFYLKYLFVLLFVVSIVSNILPQGFKLQQGEDFTEVAGLYSRTTFQVIERAITLKTNDYSVLNRIEYLFNAVEEINQNLLLIGSGPTGALQKWYDGGFSILLAHGGLLGVLVLLIYIYMLFIKSRKMSSYINNYGLHRIFTLLLFIYFILSVITEHYLITRNILPIATLLSVIYTNIKLKYFNSNYTSSPPLFKHTV